MSDSSLADGPKGWTSSSRTMRPLGLPANVASTSTEDSVSASSCSWAAILPAEAKSRTSTLLFLRTRPNLMSAMSSMLFPDQSSGLSRTEVSPRSGDRSGPASTFGYPRLPTKTPGGELPCSSAASTSRTLLHWE